MSHRSDALGLQRRQGRAGAASVRGLAPETVDVLVGALVALAGASTAAQVAAAAVDAARLLSRARAAALGIVESGASDVELLASTGYGCDTMAAGALLPRDGGLPLTEAARTGRRVVAGPAGSPGWIAVPLPVDAERSAALVVSLAGHQPEDTTLAVLAAATSAALERVYAAAPAPPPAPAYPTEPSVQPADTGHRASRPGAARADRSHLAVAAPAWLEAAAHLRPADGAVGGDVVLALTGRRGEAWLLVADVCGSGAEAAAVAAALPPLVTGLVSGDAEPVRSPAALLERLDAVLGSGSELRFVTAAAVRLEAADGAAVGLVALAGHPLPLLCGEHGVVEVGTPALALNLRLDEPALRPVDTPVRLDPGDTLLLHTDGLVDRLSPADGETALAELLARARGLDEAAAIGDLLLEALDATSGPARDDLALLVVRLPR